MPTAVLLLRSLTLGLVSGGRSSVGLAALAARRPARSPLRRGLPQPAGALDHPWARPAAALGVAGELVMDKLPTTPSRLAPPVLGFRLVAGAVCGVVLAQRDGQPVAAPALLGVAGAYAGSRLGAAARAARPGLTTALAEDAVVLTTGWAVTR
jgi:uncharacterized membrane protein